MGRKVKVQKQNIKTVMEIFLVTSVFHQQQNTSETDLLSVKVGEKN